MESAPISTKPRPLKCRPCTTHCRTVFHLPLRFRQAVQRPAIVRGAHKCGHEALPRCIRLTHRQLSRSERLSHRIIPKRRLHIGDTIFDRCGSGKMFRSIAKPLLSISYSSECDLLGEFEQVGCRYPDINHRLEIHLHPQLAHRGDFFSTETASFFSAAPTARE